jgi:diguanylate cyclase (GGDEF)-like protein
VRGNEPGVIPAAIKSLRLDAEQSEMTLPGRPALLRVFLVSAAVSLVPVMLLGVVLARSYQSEARRRGIGEGQTEARLVAETSIEPIVNGRVLRTQIEGEMAADLRDAVRIAKRSGKVLRLRLRNLAGDVVFSDDGSGFGGGPEDEALDAARGEVVARLTNLNADSNDSGPKGVPAVEVYLPLTDGRSRHAIGVVEMYLPYVPIRDDVARGLDALRVDLVVGLAALWMVLFAIAWSMSRRLRRQLADNTFLAERDALTGLANRRVFRERVARAVTRAQARGDLVAIGIIDLDRFREINDALGHDTGDAILIDLAHRLRDVLGEDRMVARLGGDEFGLIIRPGVDIEAFLERVRAVIAQELEASGVPLTIEASIGYVVAPTDGNNPDQILRQADVALYRAKTLHIGVARFDSSYDHYDPANLALITELHHAIDADQLVLLYQPKIRLADGRCDSVEALVRWNHPKHGLLTPDRFLPLAEQTDLIERLTDWVLARALHDIGAVASPIPLGVAVNVSARSLSRHDLSDRVLRIVAAAGTTPSRLTLEITETALMSDPKRAASALSQLDAFGVKISLDDFGTGQTSLAYLSLLPIDELKIDRIFVARMLDDSGDATIVRSIIDLGHNVGVRVVAEGVETGETLDALRALGCDVAQGYLIARPMIASDLPQFLESARFEVVRTPTV